MNKMKLFRQKSINRCKLLIFYQELSDTNLCAVVIDATNKAMLLIGTDFSEFNVNYNSDKKADATILKIKI